MDGSGSGTNEGESLLIYDPSKDPKRKAKSKDPDWKYGFWHDLSKLDSVECSLCHKQCSSGIKRLKQHLVGGFGDAKRCLKANEEIRREISDYMKGKKQVELMVDEVRGDDEVQEISQNLSSQNSTIPSSGTARKRKLSNMKVMEKMGKEKKSIVSSIRKTPEEIVDERHGSGLKQKSLEQCTKSKAEIERYHMHCADYFYENGVAFNSIRSRSFEVMLESAAQIGPGVKPPSYHDVRVPLLVKAVVETDKLKDRHMQAWKQYGCTIMSDGWSDGRRRHLVNFLVNSPEGTFFLESVDASSEIQGGKLLAGFLEKIILKVGKENVVQVVSDNGSTFKKAGELLEQKFPTLYWTPCATHCLNFMLADIGKLPGFKDIILKTRQVTIFLYKHARLLAFMREHTGGKELVRPGATRFATAFLTLQSIFKHKDALRGLFASTFWSTSKLCRTATGRKICDTVLSSSFWNLMEDCIRASHPFLIVLRIADADERSVMPELTMAMDHAKENIRNSFESKPRLMESILNIIEDRWSRQMGVKLYGAALFLNPSKYFDLKEKNNPYARRQRAMFNEVLLKMIPDDDMQIKISDQVDDYDNMRGDFACPLAVKTQKKKSPLDWWQAYGNLSDELRSLALRIVSLCSSASGCERNWSTFEFIHSKRRNKLTHKRLNDLVYVKYNRKIAIRFQKRREEGKNFNPLILEEFQWDNEWVEKMPNGGRVVSSENEIFDDIFLGENRQGAGAHLEASGSSILRLENEEIDSFWNDDDNDDDDDDDSTTSDEDNQETTNNEPVAREGTIESLLEDF